MSSSLSVSESRISLLIFVVENWPALGSSGGRTSNSSFKSSRSGCVSKRMDGGKYICETSSVGPVAVGLGIFSSELSSVSAISSLTGNTTRFVVGIAAFRILDDFSANGDLVCVPIDLPDVVENGVSGGDCEDGISLLLDTLGVLGGAMAVFDLERPWSSKGTAGVLRKEALLLALRVCTVRAKGSSLITFRLFLLRLATHLLLLGPSSSSSSPRPISPRSCKKGDRKSICVRVS